jgi:hypothetical protein
MPTTHYSDSPLFRQPIFPTANNLAQQRIFFMTWGQENKQQSTKQLTANLADEVHELTMKCE